MNSFNFTKAAVACVAVMVTTACANTSKSDSHAPASQTPATTASASNHLLSGQSELRVATWNVEHLAFPIDEGCRPRSQAEIDALRAYANNVDADIFALQEVGSKQAVHLLFPEDEWQVFMSPRKDSDAYECRGSGNTSTQQKVAYAVRKGIAVNSVDAVSELGLTNPGLRYGLELNVESDLGNLSILNVHMKSGCFVDNYSRSDRESCATFAKQAPILDNWIEAQERENNQYIVLGDFNHRLSAPYNHLTQQLFSNSDGSASTLINTTANLIGCHPYYPAPIDLVFAGGMNSSAISLDAKAVRFENMEVDEMLSDHCAVSLHIAKATNPLTNAVKWQTTSKEYGFLTRAIYQQATATLKQASLPTSNWVVVMDVDETILDNSPYQVNLDKNGLSFTPETWNSWVKQENANLVPGVKPFMQAVLKMGGKLALVTNREKTLDAHTWRNLVKHGLPISADNTCLMGRSQLDKDAMNNSNIINDKDLRRQQIKNGNADCYQTDSANAAFNTSHQIVMEVGDNIEDFSGVTQEDANLNKLVNMWPNRLILLPNPMYGSW